MHTFVTGVETSAMHVIAEVCVLMLLIFDMANKASCGVCPIESTEDSKEDYAMDFTIRNALRENKKCNVDWSRTYYTDDDGYIAVDCGRCSVYNLHVSAKRDTQNDPEVCSGLTPELFTSRLDCMWKNTCILRYSPATIVWSLPNQDPKAPNCVGEEPGTVDVRYSCLDKDIHVDVVMKGFQAIDSLQGLVRSHNYDWRNRIAYPKYKKRYVMDISPSADIILSTKSYFMMLSVVTFSISVGDKFILNVPNDAETDKCEVSTWQVGDIHNISSTMVRFEFLLNNTSRPSTGFDICFQWFDVENDNAKAAFSQTVKQCKNASRTQSSDFPTFDMIKDTSTQEYKGFVRSHSRYPWNYPRDNVTFQFIKSWSSEVHVLLAPKSLRHVTLQVVDVKLAPGDRLHIISGHQTVSDRELINTRQYRFQGQSVTFNFSVRHSIDRTNAGFLLCYQWYTPGQDSRDLEVADLCSSFTYNVHPCGKGNKKVLKEKCGLWKKTKKKDKRPQKHKKKHRNNKTKK